MSAAETAEPRTTLLIVDDDERLCRALSEVLTRAGFRAVVAPGAEGAHAAALKEQPDLILCDVHMPHLDGYGVLKALQADPSTAHIPVVFMTTPSDDAEKARAFRFGVVDYFVKPLRSRALLDGIARVLKELPKRKGVLAAHGVVDAAALLRDVAGAGRTGVLTVKDASGESKTLVQAGRPAGDVGNAFDAEFEELDLFHEQVVTPSETPASSHEPEPASVPQTFKRVLIADDDDVFRKYLGELLRGNAFEVVEAADGAQALDLAQQKRPWLIMSDLQMPVLDGFDLCRALREHPLLSGVPVILLSGWDDVKVRLRGLELGADDYLSKTTPGRELLIRVEMMLSRYADFRPQSRPGSAIEGRLAVMGPGGLLQMCNVSGLSGALAVRNGPRIAHFYFEKGEIVEAESDTESGVETVYEFLSWQSGRFRFEPGVAPPTRSIIISFDYLLLEGARRFDEGRHERQEKT